MKILTIVMASLLFAITANAQTYYGMYFGAQGAHTQQLSGGACASLIPPTSEKISANTPYNYTVPTYGQLQSFYNNEPSNIGHSYLNRIDGSYTGSTDMLIRWAACKWGIDENIARAAVWGESGGNQNTANDWTSDFSQCPSDGSYRYNGSQCAATYGISQIRYTNLHGTWPMSRNSTAFNLDYRFAQLRACIDGQVWNFYNEQPTNGQPTYPNGDSYQMLWGCIGSWYSGNWNGRVGDNNYAVDSYNSWIQLELNDRKWLN